MSKDLWKSINRLRKREKIWDALYGLGLHCQELEGVVRALEKRIADLEDK